MQKGTLFVIAAPSGAGKTSLVKALVQKNPHVCVSISHTTRPMRPLETNGINYFFVTDAEFDRMAANLEFLEHALVHHHQYGTSKQFVLQKIAEGFDVILEIDWQGAAQIRHLIPDTVSIFILPPSHQILEKRLRTRQQDTADVIAQRLEAAREEMMHFAEFDYLVVNDDFDAAREELLAIMKAERLRVPRARDAHTALITELLA
jgi:guanylate kinase